MPRTTLQQKKRTLQPALSSFDVQILFRDCPQRFLAEYDRPVAVILAFQGVELVDPALVSVALLS